MKTEFRLHAKVHDRSLTNASAKFFETPSLGSVAIKSVLTEVLRDIFARQAV